jgi:hypothetical protein
MAVCGPLYVFLRVFEHVGICGPGTLPIPCLSSTVDVPPSLLNNLSLIFELLASALSLWHRLLSPYPEILNLTANCT